MKMVKAIFQICLISVFSALGDYITRRFDFRVPGSIIGLILLFVLLEAGVIKIAWLDLGASWLLAELLLFFIPSAVGVIQYGRLMEMDGMKFLAVILTSTIMVMCVSGEITELFSKLRKEKVS